jgi:Spy/CpxP family protein refolding chaperone
MKAALALVTILGLVPMIQAQVAPHTPPTPATMAQHEVTRYTTLLNLTPQQVEQATTIFTTEAATASNSRTQEHTAHQALETAIKANDTAAIQSNAATLGQIETERMTAHANARAQFYALLSADQKTKYSELEQEHMMGGGGFRGGPPR